MVKLKNIVYVVLASAITVLSSCVLEEHFRQPVVGVEYPFQLEEEVPAFITEDMNLGMEQSPQCHIYAFGEERTLLGRYEYINYLVEDGSFTIPLDMRARNLYMLMNKDPFVVNEGGLEENSILNAVHISSANSEPDIFMSGVKEMSVFLPDGETDSFPMVYGVVRIDVNVDSGDDKSLIVTSMRISGCPDRTYVFGKEDNSIPENSNPITYQKDFFPSLQKGDLRKGAYFVYENGNLPVTITVSCIYDGINTPVEIPVPTLKRNHVYTVKLTGVGQQVNGTILVEKRSDGGEVAVRPSDNVKY